MWSLLNCGRSHSVGVCYGPQGSRKFDGRGPAPNFDGLNWGRANGSQDLTDFDGGPGGSPQRARLTATRSGCFSGQMRSRGEHCLLVATPRHEIFASAQQRPHVHGTELFENWHASGQEGRCRSLPPERATTPRRRRRVPKGPPGTTLPSTDRSPIGLLAVAGVICTAPQPARAFPLEGAAEAS